MHLIGFIIRTYHDARSSECQIDFSPYMLGPTFRLTVGCHDGLSRWYTIAIL